MRRADRLFQIIQVLRRTRKPLTADAIAGRARDLEAHDLPRHRDPDGQRVPIRGEAGMGYILEKGFDLPPLMLTPDEIEAAVLGAQWVAGHADAVLSRAAADLIAKIADTVPERLRPFVLEPASRARPGWQQGARPHRHGADADADSRGQENHAALSRRTGPRQRAHDLADRDRLSRSGADPGGLVRAAPGFSQLSDRPRRRCRPISTRNIRSGATCSGRDGAGAWSGKQPSDT